MAQSPGLDDPISWATLAYFVDGGGLTEQGRNAARSVLHRLQTLLGATWPGRQYAAHGGLPDELVSFSTHAAALPQFLNLGFRLTSSSQEPTFAPVRSGLLRGLDATGWRHLLLQLEVARLGETAGMHTQFEPQIPGTDRRTDVVLEGAPLRRQLNVETTTLFRSALDREQLRYEQRLQLAQIAIEQRHGVFLQTVLTTRLDEDATAAWLKEIDDAAAQVGRDRQTRALTGPAGSVLLSSEPVEGITFEGVATERDGWHRVARAVWEKKKQTAGSTPVWIRLDALDGFFQFTHWKCLPWQERVDTLGAAIHDVFSEATHVAGLVISSGLAVSPGADPAIEDTISVTAAGVGLRQVVCPHLMRETFVIPLQSAHREETDLWVAGYGGEVSWLAEDLRLAGLPPLAELWQQ